MAVTPDGRHAVSGVSCTVWWWDLGTGQCLHILTGHTSYVSSVGVTPDARYALSGSEDRTVLLWEIDWDFELPGP